MTAMKTWHDGDNGYDKLADGDNENYNGDDYDNDDNCDANCQYMSIGRLVLTKTQAIVKNFLNWPLIAAKTIIPKYPEKFPQNPGIKY